MKGNILFKNCVDNYCYDIVKFVEIIYFIVITIFKISINFKCSNMKVDGLKAPKWTVSKFEIMEVDSPEVRKWAVRKFLRVKIDGLKE